MNDSEVIRMKVAKHKVRFSHYATGAYALIRHVAVLRKRKGTKETKRILLFFSGRIGDAILFMDTLQAYKELYPKERGYELVVACRKEVRAFLSALELAEGLDFIEVDRDRILWSFDEFRKAVRRIGNKRYDTMIIPKLVSVIEYVLAYCVPAPKIWTIRVEGNKSKSSLKERLFVRGGCTDEVLIDRGMHQLNRFWRLYNEIAGEARESVVPRLPVLPSEIETPERYCVFAVSTTDNLTKCWPAERFAETIDYVIEKFGIDVCFSGAGGDIEGTERVWQLVKNKDRTMSFVGKTNFGDWIELIRRARLVVSIDSSSIHVAAATGTPAVCISGQWEGECFVPYSPDVVRDGDSLPIAVRAKRMSCYYCVLTKRGRFAVDECRAAVENETPFPCMLGVQVDDVKDAIDGALSLNGD